MSKAEEMRQRLKNAQPQFTPEQLELAKMQAKDYLDRNLITKEQLKMFEALDDAAGGCKVCGRVIYCGASKLCGRDDCGLK